jgi:hypothetical protein
VSAPKHTPGPWTVVDEDDGFLRVVRSELLIAACESRWHDLAPRSERPQNARLIAAAPQLAEACEAMLDGWGALSAADFAAVVKQATAALTKAGLR